MTVELAVVDDRTPLARLEQARQLLAEARDVDEVLQIRDYAVAARVYAQQARLGLEAQNYAAEIKLRAERRAGELFAQIPRERGFAAVANVSAFPSSHSDQDGLNVETPPAQPPRTPYQEALDAAQLPPTVARRWQQIAMVPEAVFEQHVQDTKARGRELTTAGLAQLAREQRPTPAPVRRPPETTFAQPSKVRLLVGDVRVGLRALAAASVHCVITSPPYYGLRSYGTEPTIWGGSCCEHPHDWQQQERFNNSSIRVEGRSDLGSDHPRERYVRSATCTHVHDWGDAVRAPWANDVAGPSPNHPKNADASHFRPKEAGQFCQAPHEHQWQNLGERTKGGKTGNKGLDNADGYREARDDKAQTLTLGAECTGCDAWYGHLGQEPIPDCLAWARGEPPCSSCYVCHMRTILAELWRVLRADGLLWLNLGDSYAGSGKGPTGWSGVGDQERRQGFDGEGPKRAQGRQDGSVPMQTSQRTPPGVRRKSQIGIPDRVKLAAMADRWIVRSTIPWLKRSSMPESTDDRPSNACEYVYLLAKSERVFYDAAAVRAPVAQEGRTSGQAVRKDNHQEGRSAFGTGVPWTDDGTGRNRRNSDWFFESWQGLMTDDEGEPLALIVNPQPFPQAHFATFSPKLVEPMIRAATSEKGACLECGAPWERVIQRKGHSLPPDEREGRVAHNGNRPQQSGWFWEPAESLDLGWRPTCKHYTRREQPAACPECGAAGEPVYGRPDPSRPQSARAIELFAEHNLTDEHLVAIRAAGPSDTGKNAATQTGTGKNTERVQQLAEEAKAALGGYLREFLLGDSGKVIGWQSSCGHDWLQPEMWDGPEAVPCQVLDPFSGAGSTLLAAARLGRDCTGIELGEHYAVMSQERIEGDGPMLVQVELERLG